MTYVGKKSFSNNLKRCANGKKRNTKRIFMNNVHKNSLPNIPIFTTLVPNKEPMAPERNRHVYKTKIVLRVVPAIP
jgi:predicted CopG family antitoxin